MSMNRINVLNSIPTDLLIEIFSRLPAKSVARFRSLSKLWGSMLRRPYFTELFLTRSSARPRLLFMINRGGEWLFFSSAQLQNPYEKSSLVVVADFHTKFRVDIGHYNCEYTSGLIYFPNKWNPMNDKDAVSVICNPITGQYAILPELRKYRESKSFLGFDPIDKQFKVLLMNDIVNYETVHHILTLGAGKMKWRKIQCPLTLYPFGEGICINGVLYYLAQQVDRRSYAIVCFDVRTEKFKFIDTKCFYQKLINYKGKLGGIILKYDYDGGFPLQLCMWVLEDVEKKEWSKYVYFLWAENKVVKVNYNLFVVGMTATGEIVLAMDHTSKAFYVFYFSLERKTLVSVEILGVGEDQKWFNNDIVYAFVDHVEDLFNILCRQHMLQHLEAKRNKVKTKRTSTSSKEDNQVRTLAYLEQDRRTFESVNKFDALCLLDDD